MRPSELRRRRRSRSHVRMRRRRCCRRCHRSHVRRGRCQRSVLSQSQTVVDAAVAAADAASPRGLPDSACGSAAGTAETTPSRRPKAVAAEDAAKAAPPRGCRLTNPADSTAAAAARFSRARRCRRLRRRTDFALRLTLRRPTAAAAKAAAAAVAIATASGVDGVSICRFLLITLDLATVGARLSCFVSGAANCHPSRRRR